MQHLLASIPLDVDEGSEVPVEETVWFSYALLATGWKWKVSLYTINSFAGDNGMQTGANHFSTRM